MMTMIQFGRLAAAMVLSTVMVVACVSTPKTIESVRVPLGEVSSSEHSTEVDPYEEEPTESPVLLLEEEGEQKGDFGIQSTQRVATATIAQPQVGGLQVRVQATAMGRLYFRYYRGTTLVGQWYTFPGTRTYTFQMPAGARNVYAYAQVNTGTVHVALTQATGGSVNVATPTPRPAPAPPSTPTLTGVEGVLQRRGITVVGAMRQDGTHWYYSTLKGAVAGRAYLDAGRSRVVAYLENPLLTGFLRDGGVQTMGVPVRDSYTLFSGVTYVTTGKGAYVFHASQGKGYFITSTAAAAYFKAYASLGAPLSVTSTLIRAEKGLLEVSTGRVIPHSSFAAPLKGNPRVSQLFLGTFQAPNRHTGVDYAVPTGTMVYSMGNGKVVQVTPDRGAKSWGNVVKIEHTASLKNGRKLYSQYAHLQRISVHMGQEIRQGDVVGTVGATGFATGAHLHFGVFDSRIGGHGAGYVPNPLSLGYIDPRDFLARPSHYIR